MSQGWHAAAFSLGSGTFVKICLLISRVVLGHVEVTGQKNLQVYSLSLTPTFRPIPMSFTGHSPQLVLICCHTAGRTASGASAAAKALGPELCHRLPGERRVRQGGDSGGRRYWVLDYSGWIFGWGDSGICMNCTT